MAMTLERVAIACGGTGGHLYPGLAVATLLRERGVRVRLYISEKKVDETIVSRFPEFEAVKVPVRGWPGLRPALGSFLVRLLRGWLQAVQEIKAFQPQAVLGMGGFTCAPLLVAARRRRIKTFLHESNAFPGKATRYLARHVDAVLLGFAACGALLPGARTQVTGTPVRSGLQPLSRDAALTGWNLAPEVKTVAVMGGSQGARRLNEMTVEAARQIQDAGTTVQWIHLCGQSAEQIQRCYDEAGIRAVALDFCHEMARVYSAADLIVTRAGAASLTEVSRFGLPSVLVPFPYAADDHQTRNAQTFVEAGAALCVQEADGVEAIRSHIARIIQDPEEAEKMSAASRNLDCPEAAENVVEEMIRAIA